MAGECGVTGGRACGGRGLSRVIGAALRGHSRVTAVEAAGEFPFQSIYSLGLFAVTL